jgi:DNA repair protein RecO (recombination protein O)
LDKIARDHLQRCFVLHRRAYGNSSLILELFSSLYGRLPVLAKGARRPRRSRAAGGEVLHPFRPLWLSWAGRGEVKTLTRAEPAGLPVELTGKTLLCGFYLNELLVRMLQRGDPHEDLFAFYHSALSSIAAGGDLQTELRKFELRLLHELGYRVMLDQEAGSGQRVSPKKRYVYEQESGLRPAGTGDDPNAVSGETLLLLAAGEPLSGPLAKEAKTLTRRLLTPFLGDRPLKSRELFRRWNDE